jgi:hypothetical protein
MPNYYFLALRGYPRNAWIIKNKRLSALSINMISRAWAGDAELDTQVPEAVLTA